MKVNRLLFIAGAVGTGLLVYSIRLKPKKNTDRSPSPQIIEETVIVKKESQLETLERRVLTAETKPVPEVKSNEEHQKELEDIYKNRFKDLLYSFASNTPDIIRWSEFLSELADKAELDKSSIRKTESGATIGRFLISGSTSAINFVLESDRYRLVLPKEKDLIPDRRFTDYDVSLTFSASEERVRTGLGVVQFHYDLRQVLSEPTIAGYSYRMENGVTTLTPFIIERHPTAEWGLVHKTAGPNDPYPPYQSGFGDLSPYEKWFSLLKEVKKIR